MTTFDRISKRTRFLLRYLEFYLLIWLGALINLFLILRVIWFFIKYRGILHENIAKRLICRLIPFPLILIIVWSFPTIRTILLNTQPDKNFFWLDVINETLLGSIGTINTFFYAFEGRIHKFFCCFKYHEQNEENETSALI